MTTRCTIIETFTLSNTVYLKGKYANFAASTTTRISKMETVFKQISG